MFYRINEADPTEHKVGDYVWAMNMLVQTNGTSIMNERGAYLINQLPKIVGVISVEDSAVLFTVGGIYTLFLDQDGNWTTKQLPLNWSYDFSIERPVHGVYRRNFKGELLIAWTDQINPPRIINIDSIQSPQAIDANDIEDTLIFPTASLSSIEVETPTGGNLLTGTYFVTYAYKGQDNTLTNFLNISKPVWVTPFSSGGFFDLTGDNGGQPSDKQLFITFRNVDIRYEYLVVAVIAVVNGVTSARMVKEVPINKTSNGSTDLVATFVGNEITTAVTLEEILIPTITYQSAKTLTQNSDRLYIGNLTTEKEIDYQYIVNDIKIKYTTTLYNSSFTGSSHKVNVPKTFQHGEVYAFYIAFIKPDGTMTKAFHIPGRRMFPNDIDLVTPPDFPTTQRFRIYDTTVKTGTDIGEMGFWENNEETYPTEGFFPKDVWDSNGNNLTKVRHHKFPTMAWLKLYHYLNEPLYGVEKIDHLGIQLDNVTVPTGCVGYQIFYAERTFANSTVLGTDILLFASTPATNDELMIVTETDEFGLPRPIRTTGGNFGIDRKGNREDMAVYPLYGRLHNFDVMTSKTGLINPYLDNQLRLVATDLNNNDTNFVWAGGEGQEPNDLTVNFIHHNIAQKLELPYRFRPINDYWYMPNNVGDGVRNNYQAESTLLIKLGGSLLAQVSQQDYQLDSPHIGIGLVLTYKDDHPNEFIQQNGLGKNFLEDYGQGGMHRTYLTFLRQTLLNVYNPFDQQTLVSLDQIAGNVPSVRLTGGDCFVGYHSFMTSAPPSSYPPNNKRNPKVGVFMVYNYLCVSRHNINLRYSSPKITERLYPKDNYLLKEAADFALLTAADDHNPYHLYNKDYSKQNTFRQLAIYTPSKPTVSDFPYRVARSKIATREEQFNSWRTWLASDYYEMPKNKGEVMNVEGFGDKIIIHTQFSLFVTRDKTTLVGENDVRVRLGSGDIFEINPQELLPETGHAGTHHQFSAIVTKQGYIFVDVTQGKVFLFNNELVELSNNGLKNFFRTTLPLQETKLKFEKVRIPFSSICINGKQVLVIPKHKDHYDIVPLSTNPAQTYQIEHEIKNGKPSIIENVTLRVLAPLQPAAVKVGRSSYWLYTTKDFNKSLKGYITIDCYVKQNVLVTTDNPFNNIGYSIVFDEQYNRLLLTKNAQNLPYSNEVVVGNIKIQPTLLPEFVDGSLVEYWQTGDNPDLKRKLHRLQLSGTPETYRLYVAQNGGE